MIAQINDYDFSRKRQRKKGKNWVGFQIITLFPVCGYIWLLTLSTRENRIPFLLYLDEVEKNLRYTCQMNLL